MKTEILEAEFMKLETKIHRFPPGLRAIENPRYILPSFVALGPYHHGSPHLRHAEEEVKHAAAHYFCEQSGHSVEQVYEKILSIADQARSCYDDDAVAHFSDAEFAEMMFLDGCFLLCYATNEQPGLLYNRMTLSTGPCMLRDIFLLENQLPWLVLEALLTFSTSTSDSFYSFVADMPEFFDITPHSSGSGFQRVSRNYRPAHLLGLLRYYLCGGGSGMMHGDPAEPDKEHGESLQLFSLSSSAIELAEIGIELTASDRPWFADMSVQTDHQPFPFGQLSLTPLFLNDFTACWLVNMAAYEACVSTTYPSDGFLISSYISLLAMLMDKEEDVHELRSKHMVQSFFSNQQVLAFFKDISRHLRLGHRYFLITEKIEQFKRQRRVRIGLHRFLYNNYKTIFTLLSIASVLVGIFRTLMSLKQHQQ
ncbi:hypothetical protein U9M48_039071 [Paspalum notatum var. saurae]|uniref:Uncharacterized protein n=1 Tax=Paspalum notatum var. saurae TaxID=547442 RepID=A0AAQ3XCR7_PASNO